MSYSVMADEPRKVKGTGSQAFRREVGERLRMARMLVDSNRTRLAESFVLEDGDPVHHTTWRLWEEGMYTPNPEVMVEFCRRYQYTMDWLYLGRTGGLREDLILIMYRAYPDMMEERPPGVGYVPPEEPHPQPEVQLPGRPGEPARTQRRRRGKQTLALLGMIASAA